MWRIRVLVCIVKGHAFRKITQDENIYSYCPRCGKFVWDYGHIKNFRQPMGIGVAVAMATTIKEIIR